MSLGSYEAAQLRTEKTVRKRLSAWVTVSGMLGVTALVILLYVLLAPGEKSQTARPTIAVLYVENLTDDPKYDSFSAGLTEEITSELSNVPGLQVISRSDIAPYRGKTSDSQELGKKLGVSYILESSIRADGNRVRVTCQAIQTSDRFHFWSQGITRDLSSAFEVQTEIAQQVAIGLKAKFAQKNLEQKLGLPQNSLLKQ